MWVSAKEAVGKIGLTYDGLHKHIQRHKKSGSVPKFQYRYINCPERGGKSLEIWVEDGSGEAVTLSRSGEKKPKREKSFAMPAVASPTTNRYLLLTNSEQKEVLEKVELVKSYVNREYGVTWEEWSYGRQGLPTKQHFSRLVKLYKQGLQSQNVVELFCDKRGRPKESFKMTQEMRQAAETYLLQTKIHPSDVVIYKCMRHYFGEALPTIDTVCRYLNHFKKKNRALIEHKKNPNKARGKSLAAHGNASEMAKYKNHYWELDGTPADIICSDGIRYTIIAALDVYSRRVFLTVEPKSNAYALARNIRGAILKLGVPENVITDNGRDYKSNHFENVCQNLGINKREVPPYSGQKKPHVERFFRTLTEELFSSLEGYVGPDVATRSAIQSQMSYERQQNAIKEWKRQKHTSETFRKAMTSKEKVMDVFVPISADELKEWIEAWVNAVYEQREHGGINMTPIEKYNSDITPARMIEDQRSLDVLLGEWHTYIIGKKGIGIRRDGIEALYQHIELVERIGDSVYVALGSDAGEIYVYDAEMAFVCIATDESQKGKSREHIRELHREMSKVERDKAKLVKKANELMEKMEYPTYKDVIASAAKVTIPAKQRKMEAKVDIEMPTQEVMMNGDKPFFYSDTEMFIWHLENGREAELNPELVEKRAELYDLAKREVERKTNQKAG